ncbi:MAG: two-component sensor histidine kinase [Deltaproteobacteria bacterium]|nr:two-component sensor histidine kinase [Deltaproteobacteria bacterium]
MSSNGPPKPFKLVKYFFLSSFVVVLLFALALSILITQRSEEALLKKTEAFALLLAENLNHQVFFQFVVPVTFAMGQVQLRNPDQFDRLDKIIRNTIYSFKIEKVNIYDPRKVLAYSTDRSLVGKKDVGGTDYHKAMQGKYSSRFISEDVFLEIWRREKPPSRKLVTTIPFQVESPTGARTGQILGVFEITQDISEDYRDILRDQYLLILSSTGLIALLFLILLFIVKRGETIMKKREEERKKLLDQLHQAERMASLGTMIASVSHEIKNPLGIIRSTADLLEKKVRQYDPDNRLASVIREESDRLNRVVTEFLDFARPQLLRFQPVELDKLLEKNLQFLELEIGKQGVVIEKFFPPAPVVIQGDYDLLYRGFLNILINALQAMPGGGILSLRLRNSPREVEVEIRDFGPGLSTEVLEKAFDPFFTTKEKGTGLGLAIVKNTIEAHNGTIELVNPPGGGTAVRIRLPRKAA